MSYGYTARGELETVTDWLSGFTTYAYDPAGWLTEIAYADGLAALETTAYDLDAMGTRTSMTDNTGTTSYAYDARFRLVEAEYPNSDVIEYRYDAIGNRTSLASHDGGRWASPTTPLWEAGSGRIGE